MKNLTTTAVVAVSVLLGTLAQAQDINVRVNGERVRFYGAQPREVDGRVMVPLRGVLERMGATVNWDPASETVIARREGMRLRLPIGSNTATVNGQTVNLDVPAMTIEGSTMVPLRFVSEALGANVVWMSSTQTALIETGNGVRAYRRPGYRAPDEAPPPPRRAETRNFRRIVAPAGCVIPVTLDTRLNSRENVTGDKFTATIVSGRDDCNLPPGTKFQGVVTDAIPARGGKPGVLEVDFQQIILPDGTAKTIQASAYSMDNKYVTRGDAGRLMSKSTNNNERMKWVGIGAGAGLLLGTVSRGNALLDTILGGGAGYLYSELQRKGAHNVDVGAGTEMGVRIDQRVAFGIPNQ